MFGNLIESVVIIDDLPDLDPEKEVSGNFTITPLYSESDATVFKYFSEHKDEIDKLTGENLTIQLANQIIVGDSSALWGFFGEGIKEVRFPGLLRSDLPCLWVSDHNKRNAILKLPNERDQIVNILRSLTDASEKYSHVKDLRKYIAEKTSENFSDRSPLSRLMAREISMKKSTEKTIAVALGAVFVAVLLVLAVLIPAPSDFQYFVFRSVLAISAAGFVAFTPGFLEVTVPNIARAGGAIAVLLVIYFYSPANLVSQ